MHFDEILVFRASLPLVRSQWIQLLADEPPLSPLGRTETVGYLMNVTLSQLITSLEAVPNPAWRTRLTPIVSPMHLYLTCGMTPLKKYFTTGEQAIRARGAASLGAKVEEVIATFTEIAAREIESLCAACGRHDSSCCEKSRNALG
jgi:hypothetical protein